MNGKETAGKSGMGFVGVLTLIFIVLKLTGNISWSWLWVLSPIWICALLLLALFGAIFIALKLKKHKDEKNGKPVDIITKNEEDHHEEH